MSCPSTRVSGRPSLLCVVSSDGWPADKFTADKLFERPERDTEDVSQVDYRETGLAVGVAPLASHCIRLGPANP